MSQQQGGGKARGAVAVVGAILMIIVIRVGVRLVDHAFGLVGLLAIVLVGVGVYAALRKKRENAPAAAPAYTPAPSPYDQANSPGQAYPAPSASFPPPAGAPGPDYLPPPSGPAAPGYAAPLSYPPAANTVPSQSHSGITPGMVPGFTPAPQGYPSAPNNPAPQQDHPAPNQPGYGRPSNPYAPQGYPPPSGGYQQQGYPQQGGYHQR
ncbi:hypothetical protein [Nocardia aurantiaca]|uniref:Uncharacterized protein n=1 Tax=Nocardia aurantiaca TaxID=2675850 RepID=A0A6I3KT73_9NOCA|nr:hypothetical protein [Nocardia aurantiaca]MTE12276.1 hypothetical protein [Nocardia aurantiaca]